MARKDDWDEESYYDDDEFEGEFETDPTDSRGRLAAVLGTSYGISAMVHVGLLAGLALIVFAVPNEREAVTLLSSFEQVEKPYEEDVKRDLETNEEIPIPEEALDPVVITDPIDEPTPVLKGTDMDNASDKNLEDTSFSDSYGLSGGPPAGAKGRRTGKDGLRESGGSEKTESAVRGALRWLKRAQSADGRWDADNWTGMGRHSSDLPGATEAGMDRFDVGLTGLSLLAFYGTGMTHKAGPFKRSVRRGLRWLISQQRTDGSIGYSPGVESSIYNHAIATMLLCDALSTSGDQRVLKVPAQKAVRFALAAQNPGYGWRYELRDGHNDTSVTGWMLLALKAARSAGIEVPQDAFRGGLAWIDQATDSGGNTGYQGPGGGSAAMGDNATLYAPVPTLTAVGVVSRAFAGERTSSDPMRQGVKSMLTELPDWSDGSRKVNFYYWYYATYALYQVDGKPWKAWNAAMKNALVPRQRMGGVEDGSWDPVGEWCIAGGRVYATALNALTLEIYYRYDRQHGNVADSSPLHKRTRKARGK